MPILDGEQVAKTLKADPSIQKIPIIILTASIFDPQRKEVLQTLCQGFLNKPVSCYELVATFKNILPVKKSYQHLPQETQIIETKVIKFHASKDLIKALKEEQKTNYPQLCKTMIYRDIRKFIEKLNNLALQYQCQILQTYAAKIEQELDNFDWDTLPQSIEEFPTIVQHLQKE